MKIKKVFSIEFTYWYIAYLINFFKDIHNRVIEYSIRICHTILQYRVILRIIELSIFSVRKVYT